MPEAPRRYELTVRVSTPGQEDAVLNREIVTEKQSTDGALSELLNSIHPDERAKMCPVNDAR